jgi:hypothetical protein
VAVSVHGHDRAHVVPAVSVAAVVAAPVATPIKTTTAVVVAELASELPLEPVGGAGELLLFAAADAAVAQHPTTQLFVVPDVGAQPLGLAVGEVPALHTAADVGLDVGNDVGAGDDEGGVAAVVAVMVPIVASMGRSRHGEGEGDEGEGEGLLHGVWPPAMKTRAPAIG